MEEKYNFLKQLPLYKFYDKLNHTVTDIICSDFNFKYELKVKTPDICVLHNKIERNLKNFDTFDFKNEDKIKKCRHVHYWIRDQLINNLKADTNDYVQINTNFHINWNKICVRDKCTCEYDSSLIAIPYGEFNDWKYLFDYCNNYESIKSVILENNNGCNENCEYKKSMVSLFEKYKSICDKKDEDGNVCPPFFDDCKAHDPSNVFSELICKTKEDCQSAMKAVTNVPEEQDSPSTGEPHINEHDAPSSPKKSLEMSKIASGIGLSLSGLIFIGFALFKITPLRSLLNNPSLMTKKVFGNLNEESNENFETYNLQYEYDNVTNTQYSVPYTSV
ncbi:PIR Superfamily Protein [Plasmodium ovale wallikeri]|uniref:PIR Superfamily Protein n=2 Tax=Plasmodium ovale TaxID=36330 RepID=A0A1A8ZJD0_PLAOA|nr:PIR Superfamily Protein [Plasmodium ovale wallikeri]SBT44468.1 PIR Superfamily Protein [Plasmodium ovale wallikeri]SBT78595.1 PIR protein [Plasmodium ovale]